MKLRLTRAQLKESIKELSYWVEQADKGDMTINHSTFTTVNADKEMEIKWDGRITCKFTIYIASRDERIKK